LNASYADRKQPLRDLLARTVGAPLAQLADIEWCVVPFFFFMCVDRRRRRRLDYVVRSSESKPALVPVYYVKLHLAHPDAGDEVPEPVASPASRFFFFSGLVHLLARSRSRSPSSR